MNRKRVEDKKKIMLFMPSLRIGGVEMSFITLVNAFSGLAYQVDLIVLNHEPELRELLSEKINLIILRSRRVLFSIPELASYLIKLEQPVVALSAMSHCNIALIVASFFAKTKPRVFVSEHSQLMKKGSRSSIKKIIILRIARSLYKRVDCIIAVSKGIKKELVDYLGIDAKGIEVIYNPVNTTRIRELAQEPTDHIWLMNKKCPVILAVGRLVPEKGYPTLLMAFQRILKIMSARLIIIGGGTREYLSLLQNISKNLGISDNIDFIGTQKNPYPFMKRVDLFVLSSISEGFGLVLVEAMVCRVPVVSTDCPFGPREILKDGRYGRLVPVGDADKLAQAILAVLKNPPNDDAAYRRALDFSAERCAQNYLQVFHEHLDDS